MSACKKNTEQIWYITKTEGHLEDKYAVIRPRIAVIPKYFVIALENVTEEWMARYVGTNINISMDLFRHLRVAYHPDITDQHRVLALLNPIQDSISEIEERIELERQAKEWFLEKMLTVISMKEKKDDE